jgi:hypothetical protein
VKIGTENKKELITLAVLLAILIPVALYEFNVFGASRASAAPSRSAPAAPAAPSKPAGSLRSQDSSDPRLRLDILSDSRKVKYEVGGRNIFTMEAVKIEPTIVSPKAQNNQPFGPPPPPTPTPTPPPPPIPIKYYGYANKSGDPRKVFLQQQGAEQIFVAGQGDIVARRYRVVQVTPNAVTMEDVLTSNRQTIPLTPGERPK